VLVDWSAVTWVAGSLSSSLDVDPAVAGNDVTVTVAGTTSQLDVGLASPAPQTPAVTSSITGGFAVGHQSLELALDLKKNTQSVSVTIDFSNLYAAGVANVSFTLFDIDYSNSGGNTYQDLISNIHATSTTGTLIAPTITGSANNSVTGSGTSQLITGMTSTGDTTNLGNATISFNTTDIRSITFTYGGTTAFNDSTYQHISLDNISYTVVPEVKNWLFGLFGCGVAFVSTLDRARRERSRKVSRRVSPR
jgi:hypothetical protein